MPPTLGALGESPPSAKGVGSCLWALPVVIGGGGGIGGMFPTVPGGRPGGGLGVLVPSVPAEGV